MVASISYFLRYNHHKLFIKETSFPNFNKEILLHMQELKKLYDYDQAQDLVLYN